MIKDELKASEPVAYTSLLNALKYNKVAHSYLFSGEYNPLKIEAAYLLAQSIIEGKNDFADETCNICQRIRRNEYFDVIFVDGYNKTIKKEEVDYILQEFSKTSLESSGKKVYILANINNSSAKVLNMILKFMEEPSNENTYGIFISDKKEDLLPTIVSRCQEIPFLTRDFSFLINDYIKAGFDDVDAYLLANILHTYDQDFDLNDPYYLTAKEYVYKTIEILAQDKKYIPIMFYKEFYTAFKDRDEFRKCVDYYLKIMLKMIEDALDKKQINDSDYQKLIEIITDNRPEKLFAIFQNASDKIILNAERKLLFDAIAYEIISYI